MPLVTWEKTVSSLFSCHRDFHFLDCLLSVFFSGALLALIFSGSGEYLSSPLERYADQFRTKNKFNIETLGDSGGFWVIDESKS